MSIALLLNGLQIPRDVLPLTPQASVQASSRPSVIIDVDAHVSSPAHRVPSSTIDPVTESFNFSPSERMLPSADASPEFMQELNATSADHPRVLTKRKGHSVSSPPVKKSRSSSDAIVVLTTSGIMAPTPLDSNVQASSTLSERDSQVLALSPLASFAHTNPYIPQKGPQAPRTKLSPSSASSLAFLHSLRQKGLDVPLATIQGTV